MLKLVQVMRRGQNKDVGNQSSGATHVAYSGPGPYVTWEIGFGYNGSNVGDKKYAVCFDRDGAFNLIRLTANLVTAYETDEFSHHSPQGKAARKANAIKLLQEVIAKIEAS